jgi:hypothetical protein
LQVAQIAAGQAIDRAAYIEAVAPQEVTEMEQAITAGVQP